MDVGAIQPLVAGAALTSVDACRAELVAISVVRGLLDARELEVVQALDAFASADPSLFPQEVVAGASRTSLIAAERLRERAATAALVPELGAALAAGAITGDRIDVVTRAVAGLSSVEQAALASHGARLAEAAASSTVSAFRRAVDDVVRSVRVDDGLARLERQRRASRLRWWQDRDGLWNLAGRFDPATGARLEGRLRNELDRLRAAGLPEGAPTDPVELQQHLAASALVEVFEGSGDGSGSAVPDVTVIIDEATFRAGAHDATVCDIAGRYGLPVETIRRWACIGTVTPVVVGADGVRLWLGRETRLANRAQRRALRVWYRSCALCEVPFDHCQIHHVSWYTRGGSSNIDNLLPLCSRHHHLVHEGGWQLQLAWDRTLTVTRPGGTVHAHDPPRARAA